MKLANRFKDEDKQRIWLDHQYCAICGSNNICSLHHILGTESDSILNSIMLCYEHHKEADGHNVSDKEYQSRLLNITIRIVLKVMKNGGYEFKERDILFYKKNKNKYK